MHGPAQGCKVPGKEGVWRVILVILIAVIIAVLAVLLGLAGLLAAGKSGKASRALLITAGVLLVVSALHFVFFMFYFR